MGKKNGKGSAKRQRDAPRKNKTQSQAARQTNGWDVAKSVVEVIGGLTRGPTPWMILLIFAGWDVVKEVTLPDHLRRPHDLGAAGEFVGNLLASGWYAWVGWPLALGLGLGWFFHFRSWRSREREMGETLSRYSDERDPLRVRVSAPPTPSEYIATSEIEAAALLDSQAPGLQTASDEEEE